MNFHRYYEPHWRHLRFIRNESLCHQLEMRMNPIGIAERLKIFGKKVSCVIFGEINTKCS